MDVVPPADPPSRQYPHLHVDARSVNKNKNKSPSPSPSADVVVLKQKNNAGSHNKPQEDVIKYLTDMLEDAKIGKIIGVAVAVEYATHARGNWIHAGTMSMAMIGRLVVLQKRLVDELEEFEGLDNDWK